MDHAPDQGFQEDLTPQSRTCGPNSTLAWFDHQDGRVGAALRTARERRGISARALSATLGKSPTYMSKVEAGEIQPTLAMFTQIARATEMSKIEILYVISQAGQD